MTKAGKNQQQARKDIRKNYRLRSQPLEQYDEYQDDVLEFKDSVRESLLSYFEDSGLSTPKKLINHSNEFLTDKLQIDTDKLYRKSLKDQIKNFNDLEKVSDI